ncbi:MAG TPA: tetratricopeptide repeat protein [Fimbriimonadaceae bacterium]
MEALRNKYDPRTSATLNLQDVSGTVTFLLTDVQHSTQLWERDAAEMRLCLARHDEIISQCVSANNGALIKARGEGDSHFVVFQGAADAARAGIEIQRQIGIEKWSTIKPIQVRMSIHSGEAETRDGDYYGHAVNKAARLRAIAHAGQILVSMATRELIYHQLDKDVWLEDLGEHRLKDMLRSEQVFQLCAKGLPEKFQPLNSLDAKKNNLPQLLTSFIGREEEIQAIVDKIEQERLVTLLGPGGCGKTRLALQIAAESIDRFEDGAWVIDFSTVEDPDSVVRTAAMDLGIELNPSRDIQQDLVSSLAPKQMLIVLDNCEHLGKAPAKLCELILKQSQRNRVLATSRRSLGLASEYVHNVRPLTFPKKQNAALQDLLSSESGRLMIDRAKAKAPQFQVTDENTKAVASLCAALEGIPLAIELAASRLRILSPEQLYARLTKSLDLLKSSSEDTDSRHRTLRATIDWSFNQLTDEEKEILKTLSIVPAGCSLELAELLCEDMDLLDVLERLVDHSLIRVESMGSPRYRTLETIRQYCAEQIHQDSLDSAHQKLHKWATDFAAEGKKMLATQNQDEWQKKIETEYENIILSLAWCAENPGEQNRLLQPAGEMDRYWVMKGMVAEGSEWLIKALAATGGTKESRAMAIRSAGACAWLSGDTEQARLLLTQSVDALREVGDMPAVAGALCNLASFLAEQGELEEARAIMLQAKEALGSDLNSFTGLRILQNLGSAELDSGNTEGAEQYLTEALNVCLGTRQADKQVLTVLYNNLSNVKRKQMDYRGAVEFAKNGLLVAKELGEPSSLADLVLSVSRIAYEQEHFEMSARLLGCVSAVWEAHSIALRGSRLTDSDRLRANLRESLEFAIFKDAMSMGKGLSLLQIADYALVGGDLLVPSRE